MSSLFETGIRPAINAHLAKQAAEKRDYGVYWSASSAGYCMRLNILKRLEIPPVPEIADDQARTTRVFESGHIFHEWMQRITKEAGLSIAQELELQDEDLLVRGHIDDLVLIQSSEQMEPPFSRANMTKEHLILYDYKTVNSQSFNYKRDEVGDYHCMQLGTYMYLLRKHQIAGKWLEESSVPDFKAIQTANLEELAEARIMQIEKDTLRMREQQLFWSPELDKRVVGYWRTLQGYWQKKTLPRCTCADFDGGFMARRSKAGKIYGNYLFNEIPCNAEWFSRFPENMEGWTL